MSKVCECCQQKYQKISPKTACFDRQQISFYGEGMTLYFQFMKMMSILSFVIMITYGIPCIYTNLLGETCMRMRQIRCSQTFFVHSAAINKASNPEAMKNQSLFMTLTIVLMFIIVQIFRKRFHTIQSQIDKIAGPQKYAIFVSVKMQQHEQGLNEINIRQQIISWWKHQFQSNKEKVTKLLQNDQHYIHHQNSSERSQINFQKLINSIFISYDVHQAKQIKKRTIQISEQIQIQEDLNQVNKFKNELRQMKKKINNVQIRVNNKFLVIFQYQNLAKYFYEKNNVKRIASCLGFQKLHQFSYKQFESNLVKAPLPSQILWQNHHIRGNSKIRQRFFIYFISFSLLIVGQGLVFLILYLWFTYGDDQSSIATYISGLVSAFITVANYILYQLFIFISKYEYRSAMLQDHISKSIKIIICVFFNSGLLLLAAYFILDLKSLWYNNGFVDTISYTFVYSIFTSHLLKYFNFYNIIKIYRYFKVKAGTANYTQKMANQYYEKPQSYQPYHYYSWQITLIWMACFFGSIVPIAFFCVFITFFLQYWLQKLNYLYFYKQRKPWGSLLNTRMTQILQVSQFFLSTGQIALQLILRTLRGQSLQVQPILISLILMGFTITHIFIIPKDTIIKIVTCFYCKDNSKIYDLSYEQVKSKFITSYQKQVNKYFNKNSIHNVELIRKELTDNIGQVQRYLILVQNQLNRNRQNNTTHEDTKHSLNQSELFQRGIQETTQYVDQQQGIRVPPNTNQRNQINRMQINNFGTLKTIKQESQSLYNSVKYSNI